jgi:hypothetical protein
MKKSTRQSQPRESLSIRLQPYCTCPLGEVASYLNSLEKSESCRIIGEVLVMCLLPYARAQQQASEAELQRVCWESCHLINQHTSTIRQALRVPHPLFSSTNDPFEAITTVSTSAPSAGQRGQRSRSSAQNGASPTSGIEQTPIELINDLFN